MSRVLLFLILWSLQVIPLTAFGALEKSFSEGYLGEKGPAVYAGPWRPIFHHDSYFGRYSLDDEQFYNGHIFPFVWESAPEVGRFLSDEVMGAASCPHSTLSKNFDEIRYGYRLISLSYLLEGLDSARNDMNLLKKNNLCRLDLTELIKTCRPKTQNMRTFLDNLAAQKPFSMSIVDKSHNFSKFEQEWLNGVRQSDGSVSSVRTALQCQLEKKSCASILIEAATDGMERACEQDKALFTEVCSEEDQLYGLSRSPLATHLLGTSNLVTLYNEDGMGQGCLRRFGQLMSGKERYRPAIGYMLPVIHGSLRQKFAERFLHGRAFIYGALKEFQQKGLATVFEAKVEKVVEKPVEVVKTPVPIGPVDVVKPVEKPAVVAAAPSQPIMKKPEVPVDDKSAFLQASEVRLGQNLERVDVDMLKFNYDHVFSRAEMQLLQISLKDFTERKALEEMRAWDKLGTKEGAVPLTFLKFLMDSQNHQGLYNLVGVLTEKFWVSNDIDTRYAPAAEYCELRNDSSTGNGWQLYILRPE